MYINYVLISSSVNAFSAIFPSFLLDFFSYNGLLVFWYQGHASLLKTVGKFSLSFFLRKNLCNTSVIFFLPCFEDFTSETIWTRKFLSGKLIMDSTSLIYKCLVRSSVYSCVNFEKLGFFFSGNLSVPSKFP